MDHPASSGTAGRGGWSLRREFGRLLLLAALLPALAFGLVTLFDQHRGERVLAAERLAASATVTASTLDQFVQDHLAAVAMLADLRPDDSGQWMGHLAALRNRHPALLTALAADADGWLLAADPASRVPAGTRLNVADRDYFIEPRRTLEPFVSNAFRGRGLGDDALVAVSAPVLRGGRFDGVAEGSIAVDTFTRELGDAFVARGYEFLLLDRAQRVIHATPGLELAFLAPVDVDRTFGPVAEPGRAVLREGLFPDGTDGLVARAGMRTGWTLVLAVREDALFQGVAARAWILLGMLGLVTLGVLAASWWQMRQLARGMRELLQSLRGLALDNRPSESRLADMPVELEPVAAAIRDLSGRFHRAYAELQASLAEQSHLSESLQVVVETREEEVAERTEALRRAVAELDRLSRTDPLTGALNVRGLEDWEATWVPAGIPGQAVGVLAVDIDRFKAFNDRYGHPAGDFALKRVVGAARGALRGAGDEIARTGGEEFTVVLPGAPLQRAVEVAERIRAAVRDAGIPHEDSPDGILTVSIGVAVAGPIDSAGDAGLRSAIARADKALYRAKHAGRDRVVS